MLFVLDGSKALRKAVRSVFGQVPVQRCIRHKESNVMHHLPERDRPPIKARRRRAWAETDYDRALEQLTRLADELEHTHPGAAGSLREGMTETLTVTRLRIKGKLKRTGQPQPGRGDYSAADWARPEIEGLMTDAPRPCLDQHGRDQRRLDDGDGYARGDARGEPDDGAVREADAAVRFCGSQLSAEVV
jgi:Transposase, Mutator family